MIVLRFGISRKLGTDHFGSVGAECSVEGVEIGPGTTSEEIVRIRDHWLGFVEATVTDELGRLWAQNDGDHRRLAGAVPSNGANGHHAPSAYPEHPRPERLAPAGTAVQARGGRREEEEPESDQADEKPPTDGRQLLGWASKQASDLKEEIVAFGKKKKYGGRVVEWTPQQVAAAYRFARSLG